MGLVYASRSCLASTFRSVTSEADVFERRLAKSETFIKFVFFPFCEVPKYTFELNVCPEEKHFKKTNPIGVMYNGKQI